MGKPAASAIPVEGGEKMKARMKRGLVHTAVALAMVGMLGTMLALAGCAPAEEDAPPGAEPLNTEAGANSPEHAVRKMVIGLSEGRGDVVASAIDQTTAEGEAFAEFMRGMADISGSLHQLQQETADKFGDEGLAVLEEQLDFDVDMQPQRVDELDIEIEGDRAVARLPQQGPLGDEAIEMVRGDDDRWYVVPPAELAAAEELQGIMRQMLNALHEQVQAARNAVAEANTLGELEELLGAAAGPGFPFESPDDVREGLGPLLGE